MDDTELIALISFWSMTDEGYSEKKQFSSTPPCHYQEAN